MAVTVRIPTTLRPMSGGKSEVQVEGSTLAEVLASLDAAHPGFHDRLFDDEGGLRRFVNVFVADDDVRYLQGLDTAVPDGETVGRRSRPALVARRQPDAPGLAGSGCPLALAGLEC